MADVDLGGIERYLEGIFVGDDPALEAALADAERAGLPEIQVSPLQGRLLYLLVAVSGARRVLEVGTLGGYSAIHLARALPEEGEVISLELKREHAEVARKNLERAGISGKVEVRVGDAKAAMRRMVSSGEPPFDLVFIDAEKEGYPEYLDLALELSRVGTVIVADNVLRGVFGDHPNPERGRMMDLFNRRLAEHKRLEATVLPMLKADVDGVAIARVAR